MEFDPRNKIIQLCVRGIGMADKGNAEEAGNLFQQAWDDAGDDFEKFIAAHFVARHQERVSDKLKWHEIALQTALIINDENVKSTFPTLYSNIANCFEQLNEPDNARKNYELARSFTDTPTDNGPFFHGTRADLQVGDLLTAGHSSNYETELIMNHIYFTALVNGAGLAAALAKGDGPERVYIVEPTGAFENDPNVTDKKFPGNLTRSYRTEAPLKIVGEVKMWAGQSPEDLKQWRQKLANSTGKIIN